MRHLRRLVATAGLLAVAAVTAAGGGVLLLVGIRAVVAVAHGRGPAALGDAVTATSTAAAGVLLLWLALGIAASTLDAAVRAAGHGAPLLRRTAALVMPVVGRRLVAGILGAAVLGAAVPAIAAGPASASLSASGSASGTASGTSERTPADVTTDPGWGPTAPTDTAPVTSDEPVDPGWTPLRPPDPVRTSPADLGVLAAAPRATTAVEDAVVVHRGDTLWDIAARHLPDGAGDAEIAAAWPRWYAANAAVIGTDPHHVLPGARLVPPTAAAQP